MFAKKELNSCKGANRGKQGPIKVNRGQLVSISVNGIKANDGQSLIIRAVGAIRGNPGQSGATRVKQDQSGPIEGNQEE